MPIAVTPTSHMKTGLPPSQWIECIQGFALPSTSRRSSFGLGHEEDTSLEGDEQARKQRLFWPVQVCQRLVRIAVEIQSLAFDKIATKAL